MAGKKCKFDFPGVQGFLEQIFCILLEQGYCK